MHHLFLVLLLLLPITIHSTLNKEKRPREERCERERSRPDQVEEVWHDSALTNLYERDPKYTRLAFVTDHNPVWHDPEKQWVPIKYNIWSLDTDMHWPYTTVPDYADEERVLLDPAKYDPGELQRRLDDLKRQFEKGEIPIRDEYDRQVMNEELLSEAMKIISIPSRLCGALRVYGLDLDDVYYHNAMDQAEVIRRKEAGMLPTLYMDKGVYFFFFPWLHGGIDPTVPSEAATSSNPSR